MRSFIQEYDFECKMCGKMFILPHPKELDVDEETVKVIEAIHEAGGSRVNDKRVSPKVRTNGRGWNTEKVVRNYRDPFGDDKRNSIGSNRDWDMDDSEEKELIQNQDRLEARDNKRNNPFAKSNTAPFASMRKPFSSRLSDKENNKQVRNPFLKKNNTDM
mmetsp:Transcript_10306/g.9100  ORF Transcript_10306/g.9100 Transcript_10306/m.9100 type:complete len:160 (-) Transcript_10306:350-829(-)